MIDEALAAEADSLSRLALEGVVSLAGRELVADATLGQVLLPTGVPAVDALLAAHGAALASGRVLEVSGAAGAGKTQLALAAACAAALWVPGADVLFVTSQAGALESRAREMLRATISQRLNDAGAAGERRAVPSGAKGAFPSSRRRLRASEDGAAADAADAQRAATRPRLEAAAAAANSAAPGAATRAEVHAADIIRPSVADVADTAAVAGSGGKVEKRSVHFVYEIVGSGGPALVGLLPLATKTLVRSFSRRHAQIVNGRRGSSAVAGVLGTFARAGVGDHSLEHGPGSDSGILATVERFLRRDLVRAATLEVHALLARIRFLRVFDAHELLNALAMLDSELSAPEVAHEKTSTTASPHVSMANLLTRTTLLVVDSLSSVMLPLLSRAEDRSLSHAILAEAGCRLRWMARRHNLAVLVTTYASTDPTEEDTAIDSVAAVAEAAIAAEAASVAAIAISTAAAAEAPPPIASAAAAASPSAAVSSAITAPGPISALAGPDLSPVAASEAIASASRDYAALTLGDCGAGSLEVVCESSSRVGSAREFVQPHVFSLEDLRSISSAALGSDKRVPCPANDDSDDGSESCDAPCSCSEQVADISEPAACAWGDALVPPPVPPARLDVEPGARVELARTETLRVSLGLTWALIPDASILLVADAQQRPHQMRFASLFRGSGQIRDDDTIRVTSCQNTLAAVFQPPTILYWIRD